jgi:inosose dehydratase
MMKKPGPFDGIVPLSIEQSEESARMNPSASRSRRDFLKVVGACALAATSGAGFQKTAKRRLKIGHTGITWPGKDTTEQAIKDIAGLGYHGFETFGSTLEWWENQKGGIGPVLEKYKLPLISAYCGIDLIDPAKTDAGIADMVKWTKLLKKYGGKAVVIGPGGVPRNSYDFKEHKEFIIKTLNKVGKVISDLGAVGCVHQHTGTAIESQEEVYAVMSEVNTEYVKFGPDIGQLAKGGADPVKIVKDFLPIIKHVHIKDYKGGETGYEGYVPIGQGVIDMPAIMDLLEKSDFAGVVMVELDGTSRAPQPPLEAARISKAYLVKLGYEFKV